MLRVSWPLEAEAEEQAVLRNVEQLTGIQIMPEHVVEIREVVWPEMPRTMQPDDAQRVVQIEEELGVRFLGAWTAGNGLAAVVAQAVAL